MKCDFRNGCSLAHEMSHLSGTTEDEAVALQEALLRDLDEVSFNDFTEAKNDIRSDLGILKQTLETAKIDAQANVFGTAFSQSLQTSFELQRSFMINKRPFSVLRPNQLALATTNVARLAIVRAYNGVLPSNPDTRVREFYQVTLDDSFGDKSKATAYDILTKGFHNVLVDLSEYRDAVIKKPVDGATAAEILQAARDLYNKMSLQVSYLNAGSLSVYSAN